MLLKKIREMQRHHSCLSWRGCGTCGGLSYRMKRFQETVEKLAERHPAEVLSELLQQQKHEFSKLRWFPDSLRLADKPEYEAERQRTLHKFGIPEWGFILWWISRGLARSGQTFDPFAGDEVLHELIQTDPLKPAVFRAGLCSVLAMEPRVTDIVWHKYIEKFFALEKREESAGMLWEYLLLFRRPEVACVRQGEDWHEIPITSPRMENYVYTLSERVLARTSPDLRIKTIIRLLGLRIFPQVKIQMYWPELRAYSLNTLDSAAIKTGLSQFNLDPEHRQKFVTEISDAALTQKRWEIIELLLNILTPNEVISTNIGERAWSAVLMDENVQMGIKLLSLYIPECAHVEKLIKMISAQNDLEPIYSCYKQLSADHPLKEMAGASLMTRLQSQRNEQICFRLLTDPTIDFRQQEELMALSLRMAEETGSVQIFEKLIEKAEVLDVLFRSAEATHKPALYELFLKYVKFTDPRLDEMVSRCEASGFLLDGFENIKLQLEKIKSRREKSMQAESLNACGTTPLARMQYLAGQKEFLPGLYPADWAEPEDETLSALSDDEVQRLIHLLEQLRKACWRRLRQRLVELQKNRDRRLDEEA